MSGASASVVRMLRLPAHEEVERRFAFEDELEGCLPDLGGLQAGGAARLARLHHGLSFAFGGGQQLTSRETKS